MEEKHKVQNVLVVEDDDSNYLLIKEILGKNIFLMRATSVKDALMYLGSGFPIHLVITDIKLPQSDGIEMTGIGLAKQIKEEHPETAIIIQSGLWLTEQQKQIIQGLSCDYISKPFDLGVSPTFPIKLTLRT
jgi:DNA-binding NtrC family response regulator